MRRVGEEIRAIRLRQGMSQEELAYRIEITQSDLSKIEVGRTKRPAKDILRKIGQALEIDPDRLLILADYAPDRAVYRRIADLSDRLTEDEWREIDEMLDRREAAGATR